jgi:Ser/Thr protein kinase RdoA (MazF antagonist)
MDKKFLGSKLDIKKVLALYGLKPKIVKSIKDGMINSSFFVLDQNDKQYVLRVYQRGIHKDKEILNELQTMIKFRQGGVPIPLVLENVKNQILTKFIDSGKSSWQVILMEFIKGHHLKSNEYQLICEFAEFQSRMHKLGKQTKPKSKLKLSFKKMTDWLKNEEGKAVEKISDKVLKLKFKKIVKDILAETKEKEKEILSLPAGYVHLDYDSNNIIVSGKHIDGILDFDDLSYQPLVLDSAFSLWWWLFFNPLSIHGKILQQYNQGYTKYLKRSSVEKRLLPLFIRMRNATLAALLFINIPKYQDVKSFKKALELDPVFKSLKL